MIKFGNWLFHYRNFLFPVFYLALFIPSRTLIPDSSVMEVAGLVIIISGILVRCITIGLVYIVRGGRKREIFADDLVTEGIYSVCRNPMYLGNILLLLGFGIFANSALFLVVFFPLFVLFYVAIIRAEEAFLLAKFGQPFADYMKNVNSVLPDMSKIGNAFEGHKFKWKKVVSKEHNSLFVYVTGVLLLLLYKADIKLMPFLIAFLITTAIYLLIKWLKKKQMLNE
jgi:protein-S-isoprenylcysteine O-methyltransferase Ste14